jgi:hypothetical protein
VSFKVNQVLPRGRLIINHIGAQLPRPPGVANLRNLLNGPKRLSRTRTRNSLVAYVAALALILCAALYSAHGLGAGGGHEHEHCDLCVHLSGSASSPAAAKIVGKPPLVARVAPERAALLLPRRSPLGEHLPRGPPAA